MKQEELLNDLRIAAEAFEASLEETKAAVHRVTKAVSRLPMDPDLRNQYRAAISDDLSIAICIFSMLRTGQSFPAKFAARQIMVEMARNFRALMMMNFMANLGVWKDCPVHGPDCPEKDAHAAAAQTEEFPQHVDENLRPFSGGGVLINENGIGR